MFWGLKEDSRVFIECFKGVSRKFKDSKEVSRVFQGSFKSV